MKYSFIILIDNIKNLQKKLDYLNNLDYKEIIIIGPDDYKGIKVAKGEYVNISYSSSYIDSDSLKELNALINKKEKNLIYRFNEKNSSINTNDNTTNKELYDFSLIIDGYFFPLELIDELDEKLNII